LNKKTEYIVLPQGRKIRLTAGTVFPPVNMR
jgi:hypothetical protein